MYRFFLFRLVIRSEMLDNSLFEIHRGELLEKLIKQSPFGEVRKGHNWVVASNIATLSDLTGFHFQFGRVGRKTTNIFDYQKIQFLNTEGDDVEYTDCFFFPNEQLLAIRSGHGITVSPNTISTYLCKVLKKYCRDKESLSDGEKFFLGKGKIAALPIANPDNFLQMLEKAYKVSRFTVEYGLPNPPNFKALIDEPIEKYRMATNASESVLTVKNNKEGLNADELGDSARSASVLDHTVKAKVHHTSEDKKGTVISMRRKSEQAYVDVPSDDFLLSLNSIGKLFIDMLCKIAPKSNRG